MYDGLEFGNWTLCRAESLEAASRVLRMDSFRLCAETFATMRECGVAWMLDPFHDNESWRFLLKPAGGNYRLKRSGRTVTRRQSRLLRKATGGARPEFFLFSWWRWRTILQPRVPEVTENGIGDH